MSGKIIKSHNDWMASRKLKKGGGLLEEEKTSRENVLAVVGQCGVALQHASAKLKNDKQVVLMAVRQNARAFEFASEELKNDIDIMLAFELGVLECC